MRTPLLSIGMIFRDDIRCIERCLKALQPLRDAVPCELIMADTGSRDGSRAVAEEYADLLFDFPWINDFAAARNAVLDRCSGEWFLSVDTDEYLDEDISQLADFLQSGSENLARVKIRNYNSYDMSGAYSDFLTVRLVRKSLGGRYTGAIHESWVGLEKAGATCLLDRTLFHHDGYADMTQNLKKLERNMTLLRQRLREEPENLLLRLQVVESAHQESDYMALLRDAVALVRRKPKDWEIYGAAILRHAVVVAKSRNAPEFQEWARLAEKWYPDSYFTKIDVAGQLVLDAYEHNEYKECVRLGQRMLDAYGDYFAGRGDLRCQAVSPLRLGSPYSERTIRMIVANACAEILRPELAVTLLLDMDFSAMDEEQTEKLASTLCVLRRRGGADTATLVRAVWEGITSEKDGKERAEKRRTAFLIYASPAFFSATRQEEERKGQPHAYEAFAPLADVCALGTAAVILSSRDPEKISALLETVEDWKEFPYPALSYAIQMGVPFPQPGRPLPVETLDGLAGRLAGEWDVLCALLEEKATGEFSANLQSLVWTRSLALSAVRNCPWERADQGLSLARLFVKVESICLPRYYSAELLLKENLRALPPMDRFGWYCVRAFAALDAGDTLSYVRFLRAGLNSYEGAKPMAEFLLDHTPQLQAPPPSPELLALAEKVKTMLVAYPADDPAVEALKASEAYRRVAYLIEGEKQ